MCGGTSAGADATAVASTGSDGGDSDADDEGNEEVTATEDDEMMFEVERWKSISADTLASFKNTETGMLNEFAFM